MLANGSERRIKDVENFSKYHFAKCGQMSYVVMPAGFGGLIWKHGGERERRGWRKTLSENFEVKMICQKQVRLVKFSEISLTNNQHFFQGYPQVLKNRTCICTKLNIFVPFMFLNYGQVQILSYLFYSSFSIVKEKIFTYTLSVNSPDLSFFPTTWVCFKNN